MTHFLGLSNSDSNSEDISYVLLPLEFFVCLRNVFFDFHQEKVLSYTQFKMYSTLKTHILTKSTNFYEKNPEMIKNIFFISVKKMIKPFSENILCVFGGVHGSSG